MNPFWEVRTPRLVLRPVAWADLPDLVALKADPLVFAPMLGGVRDLVRVQEELAEDVAAWSAHGLGMWTVREGGVFEGITGLQKRQDGRGLGLRFAFWPEARGRGLAREAAGAALRFARDRGVQRVVAVARRDNVASRTVLGAIGMSECDSFQRGGHDLLVYRIVFPHGDGTG